MSDTIWKASYCLLKELWFFCWFVVFTSCSMIFLTYGDITITLQGCNACHLRPLSRGVFIELHHLCQGVSVFVVLSERMPQFRYLLRQAKGIKDLFSWKMNYEMNQYISRACTSKQVELMKTKFLKMKTSHNISQMKLFTMSDNILTCGWYISDMYIILCYIFSEGAGPAPAVRHPDWDSQSTGGCGA